MRVSDELGGIVLKHISNPSRGTLFRYDEVKLFAQQPQHMMNLRGFRHASGESKNSLIAAFKSFVEDYEPVRLLPEKNGWHKRKVSN